MDNPAERQRGRTKKKRRVWPWLVFVFLFLVAVAGGAMFASDGLFDEKEETKRTQNETLITAHDKATIMIMGVDERSDDVGRSDTLMLATIDPDLDKAALLSIPRDTRVKIRGHGYDKINAAYAYGGERLTERTVEEFLGVNIDHYVIINTKAFKAVIDAIGGVDINVEKRMYYEDPWDDDGGLIIDLRPGMQHMDGKTAVTYVRYRDEEGDIGRIRRQQKFMRACMDKVTSPAIIPNLPSVVSEIMNSVRTDLSVRQIMEFAGTLKSAQKNGLETEMVPGRPLYIDGISYWIPDINKLRIALADTLGVTLSRSMMNTLEKEAREYENSIPAGATEVPADDTSIGRAVTDGRTLDSRPATPRRTETYRRDDNAATNSRPSAPSASESTTPRTEQSSQSAPRIERENQTADPAPPASESRRETTAAPTPNDNANEADTNAPPPTPSTSSGKTQ